jgi:hypothetical protein
MMDVVKLVRLALQVLSDRLLTIMGLTMAFALACWTMWWPEQNRVITLVIFVIFTYLVIKAKEKDSNGQATSQEG